MGKYTVFLKEPEAAEVERVGREAQQLHLLVENAVRVQEGFVVTADALEDFLETSGVGAKVEHLLSADPREDRTLEILSRQAVETVMGGEMSWDIEADLIGAYEHLARQRDVGSPRVSVAVSVAFHPQRFPYFSNTFERRARVHDRHDLDKAVREAWASLYTSESLRYYRSIGWKLQDVRASVLVQESLAAEASGVAVAVPDEEGGHNLVVKVVLGNAVALERGVVEPDTFILDIGNGDVQDKETRPQSEFYYPDDAGRLRPMQLPPDLASQPKVPEEALAELARLSRLALKVFGRPMVLEWALQDDHVWIVDAIPLDAIEDMADEETAPPSEEVPEATDLDMERAPAELEATPTRTPPGVEAVAPGTHAPAPQEEPEEELDEDLHDVLATLGFVTKRKKRGSSAAARRAAPAETPPASPGGTARPPPFKEVVATEDEPVTEGHVEDVEAVDPRAGEGPPEPEERVEEVAQEEAEETVEEEAEEAVGEGDEAEEGAVEPEGPAEVEAMGTAPTEVRGSEVLHPEELDSGPYLPVTEMQVLVSADDVEVLKALPGVPITGVRFDDGAFIARCTGGKHPLLAVREDPDGLVEMLTSGQVVMAQTSFPQPVYVQLSDLRADLYRDLEGGEELEEADCMPLMGFRGVSRLISEEGEPLLRVEARAIRRARRDMHMTNLHVVVPFPRTVDEVEALYNVLFEEGVRRTGNLRVYIDVAVPSTLLFLHLYSQVSDGFFVRLDELLPALLSMDPTSRGMAGTGYLTAHEKSVRQAILLVTEAARQAKKEVIIETRHTLDPGLVEFLLRIGISGICLGSEDLRENVALISTVEQRLQGEGEE